MNPTISRVNISNLALGNNTLPLTTDLTEWGKIIKQKWNTIRIKKANSPYFYDVFKYSDEPNYNLVKVKDRRSDTILEFKDYLGKGVDTFIRAINSTKYFIERGRIVLKDVSKQFQFIQATNVHNSIF